MNLHSKETSTKILDKKKPDEITNVDLLPYLFGLEPVHDKISTDNSENDNKHGDDDDNNFELLMKTRCRGCTEYWRQNDTKVTCEVCFGSYHLGCLDPPLSLETWQRMVVGEVPFVCTRCKPCRGCYKNDILYGCHPHHNIPSMLSFPAGESLDLCSMCKDAYDDKRFCPNCAHTWDDKKYSIRRKQMELYGGRRRKGGPTPVDTIEDITNELFLGNFSGDEVLPQGAKVDPCNFYPETSSWGFTEVEMLVCDGCKLWVHAGCCGVTEKEYDDISSGKHPFYSKEFLCRMCCRHRCLDVIDALSKEDAADLFSVPVSEKLVPTYYDTIKHPMDLQTMHAKATDEEYLNYAWIRELFEVMVLNALTFNRMVREISFPHTFHYTSNFLFCHYAAAL
jgi:Bromodomain